MLGCTSPSASSFTSSWLSVKKVAWSLSISAERLVHCFVECGYSGFYRRKPAVQVEHGQVLVGFVLDVSDDYGDE